MGGHLLKKCFILTAGLGTRLRPHTEILPKPCLPFLNLPLMNYGFFLAHQAGCENYIFNTHHWPEKITSQINAFKKYSQTIDVSSENHKILGSGGALWKAKEIIGHNDFLVANGDEILIGPETNILGSLYAKFKKDQALCTLLTCDHPDLLKKFKAVWVNAQNEVCGFGASAPKDSKEKLTPVHYTGYKIFSPRIFDHLPPGESNIFYDILVKAIQKGERVTHYHLTQGHWYETGDFTSFIEASRDVSKHQWMNLQKIHSFFGQKLAKESLGGTDHIVYHQNERLPKNLKFQGMNCVGRAVIFNTQPDINNCILVDGARLKEDLKYKDTFIF